MSRAQLSWATILFIVLMRLAAGFHFFNEGMKKLEPGFSSEGFLRSAKGPLEGYFKSFAPGPHGAYELLNEPRKWGSLEEEQEGEAGAPAPYQAWADQITADWREQRDALLTAIEADDETKANADAAYDEAAKSLDEYLKGERQAIQEYQHELWRLEELKSQVHNEGGSLPYLDDRIAAQQRAADATPRGWIAEVNLIEEDFHSRLLALAPEAKDPAAKDPEAKDPEAKDPEAKDPEALVAALHPPTPLDRVNTTVTWVVILSGALLFLGLFTRLAAVVAAGFLCSVLATQPPWVYGADKTYLYYQLFEVAGLLMLAAVGAGRWLGVDGLIGACFGRCCQTEPTTHN